MHGISSGTLLFDLAYTCALNFSSFSDQNVAASASLHQGTRLIGAG